MLSVAAGCGAREGSLVGRWEITSEASMSVPHSFFWLYRSHVEFREDGTLLGLMPWPPDGGHELTLNATATYVLDGDRLEITGACRHEDPCAGTYNVTLKGRRLTLHDGESQMTLTYTGPPGESIPRRAPGPTASPTPAQP